MKNSPKYGDHIRVKIDPFYHHGIYINDGEVIHYCSDEPFSILSKNLEVRSTTLEFFAQRLDVEVVEYAENERFPAEKSVELAKAKIGSKDYDLLYNNCEHFANYCIRGKHESAFMNNLREKSLRIKKKNGINGYIDLFYSILTKNR